MITDDDVERACSAYWPDWERMKTWPKTGPGCRAGMRRALTAALSGMAEPVAWLRVETQVHPDVPSRKELCLDAELAAMWKGHPNTVSVTPLYATPPASDSAMTEREFKPCVTHYKDGDFSQMLLEDCPTVSGFPPALVYPLLRMKDRALVGFQWHGVTPPSRAYLSAGWQRWLPDISQWVDVREEDLEHYSAKGSRIRQVFAAQDQPEQGEQV